MITFSSGGKGLKLQAALGRATQSLRTATERLSSGLRINRASDDAAGLAIASSLQVDSRVYSSGIRNLNDGLSLLSMADSGLESLSNITIRIRELASQAANGSLSLTQRTALNSEASQLTAEYNRLISTTKFNGRGLLDLSSAALRLQGGYGADGGINFNLGDQLSRSTGTGSFGTRSAVTASNNPTGSRLVDLDRDGDLDAIYGLNAVGNFGVMLNDGSGNFGAQTTYSTVAGTAGGFAAGDIDGDGIIDAVVQAGATVHTAKGNGDGTFQALIDTGVNTGGLRIELADFNRDGILDILGTGAIPGLFGISVALGRRDGSFGSVTNFQNTLSALRQMAVVDFNNDGNLDVVGSTGSSTLDIFFGNGNGGFSTSTLSVNDNATGVSVSDFNSDGRQDIIVSYGATSTNGQVQTFLQQADGSLALSQTFGSAVNSQQIATGDVNGDGIADFLITNTTNSTLRLLIGSSNGTFTQSSLTTGGLSNHAVIGDLNGDGAADILARDNTTSFARFMGQSREVTSLQRFDLYNAANARAAMNLMEETLDRITAERGALGAAASRVETALSVLWTSRSNFDEASSRILDADIAEESAASVKFRITQQIAASINGQANQQANLIKDLLRAR